MHARRIKLILLANCYRCVHFNSSRNLKIESINAVYAGKGVIYCRRGAANSLVDPERMPIAGLPILERFQFGKSFPGYRALARKEHLCLNKSPTSRPKLFACM